MLGMSRTNQDLKRTRKKKSLTRRIQNPFFPKIKIVHFCSRLLVLYFGKPWSFNVRDTRQHTLVDKRRSSQNLSS